MRGAIIIAYEKKWQFVDWDDEDQKRRFPGILNKGIK